MQDPDIEAHKWRQRFGELWEALEGNGESMSTEDYQKFEEWYLEL